jgi:hypothetical protein
MNLSEQDLKKIKSLHVMLKMPIWILERETNRVLKSYKSIYKHPISYEFKEKNISDEVVQFYSGMLNEIFLCLWYQDVRIVIGAFRINNVTSTEFSHVYDNLTPENKKKAFSRIVLLISKSNYQPQLITLEQPNNSSVITITSYKTKQSYSDSLFQFNKKKYPNAEIIDLR